jgi:hypothetical protein
MIKYSHKGTKWHGAESVEQRAERKNENHLHSTPYALRSTQVLLISTFVAKKIG